MPYGITKVRRQDGFEMIQWFEIYKLLSVKSRHLGVHHLIGHGVRKINAPG